MYGAQTHNLNIPGLTRARGLCYMSCHFFTPSFHYELSNNHENAQKQNLKKNTFLVLMTYQVISLKQYVFSYHNLINWYILMTGKLPGKGQNVSKCPDKLILFDMYDFCWLVGLFNRDSTD